MLKINVADYPVAAEHQALSREIGNAGMLDPKT